MSILYTNKIAHNTASNNSVIISGSHLIIQGNSYTSGSITSSGTISSSNTIYANALRLDNTSDTNNSIYWGTSPAHNNARLYDDNEDLSIGYNDQDSIKINSYRLQVEGQITASGDIVTSGSLVSNAVGNPSTITTNTTIPVGHTMVLFTSRYNPSITIKSGINYTVKSLADISILDPSKLNF
tara:strand:+ start:399 stop:947 length:549 start_codon:yes stop_codon:yes gene_type:complete